MGIVYEAQQEALNRRVAIKRLPTGIGKHLARSRAEAETLGQLRHSNIVQIYEILEHEKELYLILELVDSGSLAKSLRGKPKTPQESAEFIESIALAVHHAHTRGIVHRDLKPSNILLARKDEKNPESGGPDSSSLLPLSSFVPKVADFGIAKSVR
jgi:serine/threonine protein kinase